MKAKDLLIHGFTTRQEGEYSVSALMMEGMTEKIKSKKKTSGYYTRRRVEARAMKKRRRKKQKAARIRSRKN
jgi:hypothetical protein